MDRRSGYTGFTKAMRTYILNRDRICRACGKAPATEADHIIPLANGGENTIKNGQGLCRTCHWKKTQAEIRKANQKRNANRRTQKRKPESHPGLIHDQG